LPQQLLLLTRLVLRLQVNNQLLPVILVQVVLPLLPPPLPLLPPPLTVCLPRHKGPLHRLLPMLL
jgi:hypothetical protein